MSISRRELPTRGWVSACVLCQPCRYSHPKANLVDGLPLYICCLTFQHLPQRTLKLCSFSAGAATPG